MQRNEPENQYKVFNPQYRSRIEKFLERQYFMHWIGFDLNVIEEGRTEGWLDLNQHHLQQTGLVHGGVTATLADIVAGVAAYTLVPEEYHVVTAELKVSYLNAGKGEQLFARGWVLKQGRKMSFCESEVYAVSRGQQKLIAKATTTMAILSPEDLSKKN